MVFLLLILMAAPQSAAATQTSAPVVLTDAKDEYVVGSHVELLEDPSGSRTFSDVTSEPLVHAFEPSPKTVPSFGYTRSAYWLRFTVQDRASADRSWLLEFPNKSLDHIELHMVPDVPGFGVRTLGDALPFSDREVPVRGLVVPIPDGASPAYTVYLRASSRGPLRVPIHIRSEQAYVERDRAEHLFLGALFGILLIMGIYNLSLYASLGDRSHLYYVLYILSFLIWQLSVERFGLQYLWPESLWWAERSNSFFGLFCAIWGFQFTRSFLHTPEYAPRFDKMIIALGLLCIPLMALVFFGPRGVVNPIVVAFFIVSPVVLLAAGFVCLVRGDNAAVYYLLAWSFLLAGTVMFMLGHLGVLSHPFFGIRSIQVGSVLEITMLSLGLGYRYDQLRRERERMRLRIATDLHDDIGSGLTQISLYSELAQRDEREEALRWARETGELARNLTGRMQDIVWAVRPEDSSWASLEMRMKDYATRLLAPCDIAFDMQGDVERACPELSISVRKNTLMMFKEIVHNAVKHASCSRFDVRFRATRSTLWLRLSDDGCGFDPETTRGNNGLRNLRHRAGEIHADFHLDSQPGGPTCYTIDIPLNRIDAPDLMEADRGGSRPTIWSHVSTPRR